MVDEGSNICILLCMKTVTIVVDERVYMEFQRYGKKSGRSASELIREAMEEFGRSRMTSGTSLSQWRPASAGRVLRPLGEDDDLLGEMATWGGDDAVGQR